MPSQSYDPNRKGVLRTALAQAKAKARPVVKPAPSSPDVVPPPPVRGPTGRSVDPGFYRAVPGNAGPTRSSAGNLSDYKNVQKGQRATADPNLQNILTYNETHQGGKEIGRFNATHTKGRGNADLLEILRAAKQKQRKPGRTTYTPGSGIAR